MCSHGVSRRQALAQCTPMLVTTRSRVLRGSCSFSMLLLDGYWRASLAGIDPNKDPNSDRNIGNHAAFAAGTASVRGNDSRGTDACL